MENEVNYRDSETTLELDVDHLETVRNPNVRNVALLARDVRERMESDPEFRLQGTYTEAYQGERA